MNPRFDSVKREASVILARTRRCDRGVLFPQEIVKITGNMLGR